MFLFAVRTFVTEFKLKKTFPNSTVEKHSDLHEVENEVTKTVSFLKGILLLGLCFLEQISFRIGSLLGVSCVSRAVHFCYVWKVNFGGRIKGFSETEGGVEKQRSPVGVFL